jgi:PKD repeat protein
LGTGWWDATDGSEIGDKCNQTYSGVAGTSGARYNQTVKGEHFLLQDEWSNEQGVCAPLTTHLAPHAAFTGPTTAFSGQTASFDGSVSTAYGGPATYTWDFGDGSPQQSTQTASHAYAATGSYAIGLTVTDSRGFVDGTTQPFSVTAPPPPPPPPPPSPVPAASSVVTGPLAGATSTGTGGSGGHAVAGNRSTSKCERRKGKARRCAQPRRKPIRRPANHRSGRR